jgi:two-component system chemotaxis response regulator CheB
LIRAACGGDPRLQVVGEAGDPFEAREAIKRLNPDVITLDIEMPRMCGLSFLERLMRLRPLPVIMVSSRTTENSEDALRALSMGAVECLDVTKLYQNWQHVARLSDVIYEGSLAKLSQWNGRGAKVSGADATKSFAWNGKYLLLGSSTGGVYALEKIFSAFPEDCPPTIVVQHMPFNFIEGFAARLSDRVKPEVRVAQEGDAPKPGVIYLARQKSSHLVLSGPVSDLRFDRQISQSTDYHVPSVDALFQSASAIADHVIAAVLTGMGRDGADGLLSLCRAGADTIAQTAETCVVAGMPNEARAIGAVKADVALDHLAEALLTRADVRSRPRRRLQ